MNAIIITLIVYQLLLISIGWWASRRNQDGEDFYLGGRKLGPWVSALSASASSSSAWSLLGVSGAAYTWGLAAVWLIPATLLGFVINWVFVAPRMREQSRQQNAVTLTEFIAGPKGDPARRTLMLMGALIILFSFTFYIASQFQAAGATFSEVLDMERSPALIVGASVVLLYVLLGGFWAASVTDTLQGLLMALCALILPILALSAIGGPGEMLAGLARLGDDSNTLLSWNTQTTTIAGIGFVFGLFGIGLGYPGQPHVVNRFMAIERAEDIPRARLIALSWAVIIYTGMVTLGLCGRVLFNAVDDSEQVLFVSATNLLPPVFAGIMISAILSAIMSTADSQLLVAGSAISHDMRNGEAQTKQSLVAARWVVLIVGILAVCLAIWSPQQIFDRVLFAWQALAAAFGPLLVITFWKGRVSGHYRIAAMASGFLLTIGLSLLPNTPGDVAEKYIPMGIALILAWIGHKVYKNNNL